MKVDVVSLVRELADFPLISLIVLGAIFLAGLWVYVRAQRDRKAIAIDDGNRAATLFDLSQELSKLREASQAAISERHKVIYERLDDHGERLAALESRGPR